jgi:HEAT repeat protein
VPADVGVFTLDVGLRVLSWNRWLEAATGVTEAAVRSRPAVDAVPFSQPALIQEIFVEVIEQGSPRVLSPLLHRSVIVCPPATPSPHFTEMQQAVTVAPLRTDAGAIVGVIVTVEDVTARLDAERELVARAGASDWTIRAAATQTLKRSASREQIAELLVSFARDHQSFSVLSGALAVIASVGRDITHPLIELLHDSSPNLRLHAALALGAVGGRQAVPALIHALEDADQNVRFHAIESLGRLAAPEAVAPLAAIAESADFFVAFPAIDALAKIEDAAVLPALVSLLDQEFLRPAVVDALASLGDEDCIAPLCALVNGGGAEASAVASALVAIAARYDRTLRAGDVIVDLVRGELSDHGLARLAALARPGASQPSPDVITVAGWMGGAGLELVVGALGVPALKGAVEDAVGRNSLEAVPRLIQRLDDEERGVRIAAIELLGRYGDRRVTAALLPLLAEHDTAVVVAAVAALARIADPDALDVLVPLFEHSDFMVRHGAVAAVQSIGDNRVRGYVRAALGNTNAHVRECAIRVAGYLGFADCAGDVHNALRDPDEDVRRAAIEQLFLVDGSGAADALIVAVHEETPRNRGAAAHALRLVDSPEVEGALLSALGDQDPWVRYFASSSLGERGTSASASRLVEIVETDSAAHVRIAAIESLSRVAPEALAGLMSTLIADANTEVVTAAIAASGRIPGPGIDEMLAHAIQGPSSHARIAAAGALADRGTTDAVQTLELAAQLADPPALTTAALDALTRIANASDIEVRRAAIHALINLGADVSRRPSVVNALATVGSTTIGELEDAMLAPRTDTRILAIEALARIEDPRASDVLLRALDDAEASVRSAAVAAFGRLGSRLAASRIVTMTTSDTNMAVRRHAAAACRRHGWASSGDRPVDER